MVELDAHVGYVDDTQESEDKGHADPEGQVELSELEIPRTRLGYVEVLFHQCLSQVLVFLVNAFFVLEVSDYFIREVFEVTAVVPERDVPAEMSNEYPDPDQRNYGVDYN